MAVALPVNIIVRHIQREGIQIYFPEVVDLENKDVLRKINDKIVTRVEYLIDEQFKQQGAESFIEMIGTFEIKTNQRHVLSLTFGNYAYAANYAHGLTLMDSLTVDVETGNCYALQDLFKPNNQYVDILSKEIQRQIIERDLPMLNNFQKIDENQPFYIADKSLNIYFQAYEITPGYVGIPVFPINSFLLQDILLEQGPLARMLPSL